MKQHLPFINSPSDMEPSLSYASQQYSTFDAALAATADIEETGQGTVLTLTQEAVLAFYTAVRGDDTFDRNAVALLVLKAFDLPPTEFLWKKTTPVEQAATNYANKALSKHNLKQRSASTRNLIQERYNSYPRPWVDADGVGDDTHPDYQEESVLLDRAVRAFADLDPETDTETVWCGKTLVKMKKNIA